MRRLCHGDLSLGNTFMGPDCFWLIAPRDINGEPAYDVAVPLSKPATTTLPRTPGTADLAEAAGADSAD